MHWALNLAGSVPKWVNDYPLKIIPARKKKGKLNIIFAYNFADGSRLAVAGGA
jgi:hypothetical protein